MSGREGSKNEPAERVGLPETLRLRRLYSLGGLAGLVFGVALVLGIALVLQLLTGLAVAWWTPVLSWYPLGPGP